MCVNWLTRSYYLSADVSVVEGKYFFPPWRWNNEVNMPTLYADSCLRHSIFSSGCWKTEQIDSVYADGHHRASTCSASTLICCTCLRALSDINHRVVLYIACVAVYLCVFILTFFFCNRVNFRAFLRKNLVFVSSLLSASWALTSFSDKAFVFQICEGGSMEPITIVK